MVKEAPNAKTVNNAGTRLTPRQSCLFAFALLFVSGTLLSNLILKGNLILEYMVLLMGVMATILVNIAGLHRFLPMVRRTRLSRGVADKITEEPVTQLPRYSVLVPLYEEGCIVQETVRHLTAIDYPGDRLEVLLLIESSDMNTRLALPELPQHFVVIDVPVFNPRGKQRVLNYGLDFATGELITVYDAEDIPESLQLQKAATQFYAEGANVWALQARLQIDDGNLSWLTRLYYLEYKYWYEVYVPFLATIGYPVPLGGTSNHIRRDRLLLLGGWDDYNVTEDADLCIRIYKNGGKIGLLNSTTIELPPHDVSNWICQRTRWIKGLLQTVLVHSRGNTDIQLWLYFLFCYSGTIILVNVILLSIIIASTVSNFAGAFIFYLSAAGFIISLLMYAIQCCFVYERETIILGKSFLPGILGYWGLYLIANARAIYQLIKAPYLWEKTTHIKR